MSEQKFDLILNELQAIKQGQFTMKEDQQAMKQDQQAMKEDYLDMNSRMNNRFDTLETKMDQAQGDITDIKTSMKRIDRFVHEDIVAILQTIEAGASDNKADTVVLNNRLFKLESQVQKITKQ